MACQVCLLARQLGKKGNLEKGKDALQHKRYQFYRILSQNLSLASTRGTWNMGAEHSDFLSLERNHRRNCNMSQKCQKMFPLWKLSLKNQMCNAKFEATGYLRFDWLFSIKYNNHQLTHGMFSSINCMFFGMFRCRLKVKIVSISDHTWIMNYF